MGIDQYEGYCIDLINELSRMSGFKYTFIVQEDGNVGQLETLPNGTQQWNGMIGKVRRGVSSFSYIFLLREISRLILLAPVILFYNRSKKKLHYYYHHRKSYLLKGYSKRRTSRGDAKEGLEVGEYA